MNECNTSLFANPSTCAARTSRLPRCGVVPRGRLRRAEARRSRRSSSGDSACRRAATLSRPTRAARARRTRSTGSASSARGTASSGRATPLMDGLDLHPYPIPQTSSLRDRLPGPRRRSASRTCPAPTRRSTTRSRGPAGHGRTRTAAGQLERGGHPDDARVRGRAAYTGFENGAGVAETGSEAYRPPGTEARRFLRCAMRT